MNWLSILATTVVAALGGWVVPFSQGATWYVDSAVSGGDGKSWSGAWKTLGAISGVQPGDQVWIAQGTYPVPSGGWKPKGGSASAPVTYQVAQEAGKNGMVIIDGTGSQYLIKPDQGNWVLSGYVEGASGKPNVPSGSKDELGGRMQFGASADAKVFLGQANNNSNIKIHWVYVPTGTRFIRCENGTGITGLEVSHCWYHKVPDQSELSNQSAWADDVIYLSGESQGGHFHHNYFEICASMEQPAYGDDGFKWPTDDLIENNHIKMYIYSGWHTGDKNQHSDMVQGNPNGVVIRNNWFDSPTESVFAHYNRGGAGSFSKIYFYNNLVTQTFPKDKVSVGRVVDFDPQPAGAWSFSDVLIANNTVTNFQSTFPLMRLHAASSWNNCRIQNNAFYNCSNAISVDSSQIVQTANSTNSGPSDFVNASGGDYHLSSGSSLKGAGTNAPKNVFTTDFDGLLRGDPWDIGAYAYAGGAPGPTPSPTATPSPTPPAPTPTPTPVPGAKFQAGDLVTPTVLVNVRSTPAGPIVGTHNTPDIGTVVSGPLVANLNGAPVNWYDIGWSSAPPAGWTGDDNLVIAAPTPSPSPTASPTPTPTPQPTPTPSVTWEKWINDLDNWIRGHPPYPD